MNTLLKHFNIENLEAENVSTKTKIEAISKYSDNIVENIINYIVKKVIGDKVREKEENLNSVEELNEIMPFKEYEKYVNDATKSQYNEPYNPNYNLHFIFNTTDVWYESVDYIIFSTMRKIFRKHSLKHF